MNRLAMLRGILTLAVLSTTIFVPVLGTTQFTCLLSHNGSWLTCGGHSSRLT